MRFIEDSNIVTLSTYIVLPEDVENVDDLLVFLNRDKMPNRRLFIEDKNKLCFVSLDGKIMKNYFQPGDTVEIYTLK